MGQEPQWVFFDSSNNNLYFNGWNFNSELCTKEEWESF